MQFQFPSWIIQTFEDKIAFPGWIAVLELILNYYYDTIISKISKLIILDVSYSSDYNHQNQFKNCYPPRKGDFILKNQ